MNSQFVNARCLCCHEPIVMSDGGQRDPDGKRHVCGDTGAPLQRSYTHAAVPLGKRADGEPLRKAIAVR